MVNLFFQSSMNCNKQKSFRACSQPFLVLILGAMALTIFPKTLRAAITIRSLLGEMVDYDSVARWPQPEFTVRQASSYDRARIAPDKPGWFSNNDSSNFIRKEMHGEHEEYVLLDTDGPGAIVRFFLTSSGSRKAKIHVYLDDAEVPSLDWPTLDLSLIHI